MKLNLNYLQSAPKAQKKEVQEDASYYTSQQNQDQTEQTYAIELSQLEILTFLLNYLFTSIDCQPGSYYRVLFSYAPHFLRLVYSKNQ